MPYIIDFSYVNIIITELNMLGTQKRAHVAVTQALLFNSTYAESRRYLNRTQFRSLLCGDT